MTERASGYLSGGRIEDHPFADLAGLIFREGRTGELILESGPRRRSVWFLGGNPVAVVSEDPQDHLAHFLLEQGRIGPDEARRLGGMPETREALAGVEFLPKESLTWGVKYRFVNLCYDLFRWDEGDYAFRGGDPPHELFLLKVPSYALILKGVGFVGQATVVEAVPDDAVCAAGPVDPASARYLAPDVRALLGECEPGRTVGEVLARAGEDVVQSRRLLYGLACLGLVSYAPAGPPAAAASIPAPDSGEHESGPPVDAPPLAGRAAPEEREPSERNPWEPGEMAPEPPEAEPPPETDVAETIAAAGGIARPEGLSFDAEQEAEAFVALHRRSDLEKPAEPPVWTEGTGDETPAPEPARRASRLPRVAGIALGALSAAGLLGAAWWWMSGGEPAPPPAKPPTPVTAAAPKGPAAPPAPGAPLAPAPAAAPSSTAEPAAPVAPAPAARQAPPAPPAPPEPAKPRPPRPAAPTAPPRGNDRYRTAFAVYEAGDLDGAAAIWEAQLAERRSSFTLLVMTACSGDTIRDAQRALAPQQLYLVAKKVKGRDCFRVCVGVYDSREAAGRALAGLPDRYRSAGTSVRPVVDVLGGR